MPRQHASHRELLDAVQRIPSISELLALEDGRYLHELDLEVILYGRNYGGYRVGPYARLLSFEPDEVIVNEGDWGGNTLYMIVSGHAELYVRTQAGKSLKVVELPSESTFGEMSVLAGIPRNATVRAPKAQPVQVLEIARPALRLLRKLPTFQRSIDKTYRSHGRDAALRYLKQYVPLTDEHFEIFRGITQFRVYSKKHELFRQDAPMDKIYILAAGWIQRKSSGNPEVEDFLGKGYCFGLEGLPQNKSWPYTLTIMARSEILELRIARLRQHPDLLETLRTSLTRYAAPLAVGGALPSEPDVRIETLLSQERLINTGIVEGVNLLVMDMNLCVHCGNCSFACHQVHGHSRLVRRGIHVSRPSVAPKKSSQSILAPAVCMHCKDPECLTGCPTGSIGRFTLGQIDIDAKTCIGCGDCATQCPYDAISLVPRQELERVSRHDPQGRTRTSTPAAGSETREMVAIKCNLCQNTPMNPPGSKRPAYSCEDNCPTGALARVNPNTYFTEIGNIEGFLRLNETHAIGRNIHQSDPLKRIIHGAALLLILVLSALAFLGIQRYGLGGRLFGFLNMRWITGLAGLVGIAGAVTYSLRRRIYRRRAGALRYWMLAHGYLGALAFIMLLFHSGARSGALLTSTLTIAFHLSVLSGLYGILCYLAVPRLISKIEGTPLLLDDLVARREELRNELSEIAVDPSEALRDLVKRKVLGRYLSLGFLFRQFWKQEDLDSLLESARDESEAAQETLSEDRDRSKLKRAFEAVVTLRRAEAIIFLHRLLKSWLFPHVAFASLLLTLLAVHIFQVIFYASR